MTMQKVSNFSHVTIIVPPFNRGQKKHHPRKKSRETAHRGAAGSTVDSISHDSTDCKEKSGAYHAAIP